MTLYARQQKRHRCKEQTFGLCGRRWGWDDLREWHWNMYIIICETDINRGSMHETRCSGLVHWDDPEGWDGEGGGREGQDGEHMYTHGWYMWILLQTPPQYKKRKKTRIPLGPSGIFPSVTKQNKPFPESSKLLVAGWLLRITQSGIYRIALGCKPRKKSLNYLTLKVILSVIG